MRSKVRINQKVTITINPAILSLIESYKGDIPRSKFISRSLEYVSEHYQEFNKWYSKKVKETEQ